MSAVMSRLLAGVTKQDLADLDAEIARLQTFRVVLAAQLAAPHVGAPAVTAAADEPKKEQPARSPLSPSKGKVSEANRLKIARLLTTGTFTYAEILRETDIPDGSLPALLQHEWFAKTDPEKKGSTYKLTEAGKTAIAESGPSSL